MDGTQGNNSNMQTFTDGSVKSAKQLGNIYFDSVGHGAVLLLNLSPNKTGSVGEPQLSRFKQFGENIKNTFQDDLAKEGGVTVSATSVWKNVKAFSPNNLLDEVPEGEMYWASAEGEMTDSLEIDLGGNKVFEIVSIEEIYPERSDNFFFLWNIKTSMETGRILAKERIFKK